MTDIVAGPLGGMRTLDIAVKTPGIESLMTVSFAVTGRVLERGAIQLIFADEYEMSPNPTVRIEPAARPPPSSTFSRLFPMETFSLIWIVHSHVASRALSLSHIARSAV
jgi:hypothetical protein